MRAFKYFQRSSGEAPLLDFINTLVETSLIYKESFFSGLVPDGYAARTALTFRQKLLRVTVDNDLSVGVMLMLAGKNSSPYIARLPHEWRTALAKQGLRLHKLSVFFWQYTVAQKFKEAISFYRLAGKDRFSGNRPGRYALLLGLHSRAYSGYAQNDAHEYKNFLSWFHQKWDDLKLHVVANYNPAEEPKPYVCFRQHAWPALAPEELNSYRKQARLVLWRSLAAWAQGRWQYAFMARDILELLYVSSLNIAALPAHVAITNSHYFYRPLWSYYLEDCGIETGLYFYSTNTFNIGLRDGPYGLFYGYNLMSWSHYYTATQEHAEFLQQVNFYPKTVHVVGTIPLEDNGMKLPEKKRPAVAYFDVQPFRDAFMASIGRPTPLYTFEASRGNIEDILAVCKRHGYDLFIKPKRDVGNRLCPRYRRYIEMLAGQGDLHILDSYIAADRVVEWADVVICQPFTSVAIVAREYRRPSVYYDGLKLVQKEQPAAQGIKVIQEPEELSAWVMGLGQAHADVLAQ